jgi:hypothetical protein
MTDTEMGLLIADIKNYWPNITSEEVKQAIFYGSIGKYGYTYKLSIQVICIWIDKYLQEPDGDWLYGSGVAGYYKCLMVDGKQSNMIAVSREEYLNSKK